MVTWSDVERWRGQNLDHTLDVLAWSRKRAVASADAVETMDVSTGWSGAGAKAAQSRREKIEAKQKLLLANIGALIRGASSVQNLVGDVETLVTEAYSIANFRGFTIATDGSVTDPKSDSGNKEALIKCKEAVSQALKKATEADLKAKALFSTVAGGKVDVDDGPRDKIRGLLELPPKGASTEEIAAYWKSLTKEEQDFLIRWHPDEIGNLDGIEGWARDKANRASLRLKMQKLENTYSIKELKNNQRYQEMVSVLKALEKNDGKTQLLVFDPATGENGHEHTRAAIAAGNIDTADHVSTYVPGMTTNIHDSMIDMTQSMVDLKNRAENISHSKSVAMVGWIGYDAPVNPVEQASAIKPSDLLGIFKPENLAKGIPYALYKWGGQHVDFSVLGPGEAKMGGKTLARFQEGIRDSRNVGTEGLSKVHQSVLGHSYGSTTASYGVAQVRPGVVDEFVVFGSPGVKDGSWQMNTPARHNYVLRFADDPISSGNTFKRFLVGKDTRGWFGTDPYLDGGFKKLDPYGPNTKETGHSGYLADRSDSQLQLAKVITGQVE